MSTLKLYAVADEYLRDLNKIESLELDAQTYLDTLEGLSGDIEVKALNVMAYARNLEAESDAIQAAIEAMQNRMKALDRKAEWMREYLKTQMERTGITEIKSPYFVMKLQDNPVKVVIDCEAALPDDCWRLIPEKREPDKKAIKAKLDAGENLAAAHLEKGKRLVVK